MEITRKHWLIGLLAAVGIVGAAVWRAQPVAPPWQATGTVEATTYEVSSRWGGDVRRLTVRAGDTVRAGEVLATVERSEMAAQEDAAAAALRGAEAALAQA